SQRRICNPARCPWEGPCSAPDKSCRTAAGPAWARRTFRLYITRDNERSDSTCLSHRRSSPRRRHDRDQYKGDPAPGSAAPSIVVAKKELPQRRTQLFSTRVLEERAYRNCRSSRRGTRDLRDSGETASCFQPSCLAPFATQAHRIRTPESDTSSRHRNRGA